MYVHVVEAKLNHVRMCAKFKCQMLATELLVPDEAMYSPCPI